MAARARPPRQIPSLHSASFPSSSSSTPLACRNVLISRHSRPALARPVASLRRHIQSFRPPPEIKTTTPGADPSAFDAPTYLLLRPPPTSQVAAFAYRVGLLPPQSSRALEERILPLVMQVCTHPSWIPFWRENRPKEPEPPHNAALDVLGNSLLGLFAAEFVHATWPHLPTKATKAAVSAFVGPKTLCAVANELGAAPLLRWQRMPRTETQSALIHSDALMTIPRSLVGLIYQLNSIAEARKFAEAFFLSRQIDLRTLLKFENPKLSLVDVLIKFGWERPVTRLLSESGRFTPTPVFVVGVYSGATKLGESYGSSLKMAEYRACEDALWRLYLTRAPKDSFTIPSATLDAAGKDALFRAADYLDSAVIEGQGVEAEIQAEYVPPLLGESEVRRDYKEAWEGKKRVGPSRRRIEQEREEGEREVRVEV